MTSNTPSLNLKPDWLSGQPKLGQKDERKKREGFPLPASRRRRQAGNQPYLNENLKENGENIENAHRTKEITRSKSNSVTHWGPFVRHCGPPLVLTFPLCFLSETNYAIAREGSARANMG